MGSVLALFLDLIRLLAKLASFDDGNSDFEVGRAGVNSARFKTIARPNVRS